MARKVLNSELILKWANSILSSKNIVLRSFTPRDEGFPITDLQNSDLSIASFDAGGSRAIQTITAQLVSVSGGRVKQLSDLIDTLYDSLHQKLTDWSTAGGTDWRFISVTIPNIGTQTVYDAKNPGTRANISVRVVAEYIGS